MRPFSRAALTTLFWFVVSRLSAQDPQTLLARANEAYRSLRAAEAADLYRQYLARYPDRADVRVFLGGALLNLDELQGALDEANRAIALDPRYAKGYVLAGRALSARQLWSQAQVCFGKAQGLDPRDLDAWYFSGRAFYDASRFEPAIEAFQRAVRIAPEQTRIYENLGLAEDALGQFELAEKSFRKAVDLAQGAWRPYLAYGAFLFRQDRAVESLPMLRKALSLAPDSVDVRFEFARVLYQQNSLQDAAQVLEPALPSNECRVHNLLARIYSVRGNTAMADAQVQAINGCKGSP